LKKHQPTFSIHITTKNRVEALALTLQKCELLLSDSRVECIICDDASTDGTSSFVKDKYPSIRLITHKENKGYIYNRNYMLAITEADFAISLDDDAYFLSSEILHTILDYFEKNKNTGLIACRIFWGLEDPISFHSNEKNERVQGYVGCGHIWRMEAWRTISNYPEWFVFYGEEQFGAYQLFKIGWEVHYVPSLFIKHCVDLKSRKVDEDYMLRMRRSLRAGWYLMFLFYPKRIYFRRFFYSLWIQFKTKIFKGNLKAFTALILALLDAIRHIPYYDKTNRISTDELAIFESLPKTKIYWEPYINDQGT
jgi:glycosyltransferase involved in cell wall biosynthesis